MSQTFSQNALLYRVSFGTSDFWLSCFLLARKWGGENTKILVLSNREGYKLVRSSRDHTNEL